jgi:hypothetical protein
VANSLSRAWFASLVGISLSWGCQRAPSQARSFPEAAAEPSLDSEEEGEKSPPSSEASPVNWWSHTQRSSDHFVLLELFTSEGCSSCPPADAVLRDLRDGHRAKGAPVAALSFHVDYWNGLGWTDPFSQERFSDRQRTYAAAFGSGRVYTPQLVVNGHTELVGSRRAHATRAVSQALEEASTCRLSVNFRTEPQGATLRLELQARVHALPDGATLSLATCQDRSNIAVPRGENGGRTLSHVGVVQNLTELALDRQGVARYTADVEPAAVVVAFVQGPGQGLVHCGTRFSVERGVDDGIGKR